MIRHKARRLLATLLWLALWPAPAQSQSAALMHAYNQFSELYAQGRYQEALPFAEKAVRLGEQEFAPDHPTTANLLNNLGLLYSAQGRYAEAEPLYQRSLAIWQKALGPDHRAVATSLNNIAVLYRDQGRYAEAATWFRKAAVQGHPFAQASLGFAYLTGHGVEQNDAMAAKWLEEAANHGDPNAQVSLAILYAQGRGVSQDDGKAVTLLQAAAEAGHHAAKYRLGQRYTTGDGVPKDRILAYLWLTLSAMHFTQTDVEHEHAIEKRDKLIDEMSQAEIDEAEAAVRAWQVAR